MSEAPEIMETAEDFQITDDQTADWAVRKIKDADAELERMKNWFEAQIIAAKDRHDQTVSYFSGKLAQYMDTVPARETKTTRKYSSHPVSSCSPRRRKTSPSPMTRRCWAGAS